jgi:hypothetical protein
MHQMSQSNISAASMYSKERSHSVDLSGCLEKAIAKSVIFLLPANSRERSTTVMKNRKEREKEKNCERVSE